MAIFRTFRPDGSLQFDAAITPYCLLEKGYVSTVSTTGSNPHWSGNSPSSALIPMNYDSDELIALYLPGYGYARYANLSWNGSWWHIFHTMAPVGSLVTYYRFAYATTIPGYGGAGLQLFNPAGQRTFHSSMRPAIVAGTLSGLYSGISLPAGRQYASVVQTQAGHERTTWSGGQDVITDDKGQVIAIVWTGDSDQKLYGVRWLTQDSAQLVEVEFNGGPVQSASPTQPADTQFYRNEIENVLFLDVTNI
ncbi:hypothetical protein [Sphingomonas azotifigens]|uniref:hypothetical protein n=1 Tax=Sphingomonas azotifigens TaxID=330920 RepID=UPI0009FBD10D|nr:hypothetical protein [Sphingomonas azotifigens]